MMVGYPGSGKTTVAITLHKLTGAEHIWTDLERKRMFGTPTHSLAESTQLYTYLNQKVEKLLSQGRSVIFDTNFNYYKDRQLMRDIADRQNAASCLIWVQTDPELAYSRASKDTDKQPTRILGGIEAEDFHRIAQKLQPPKPGERAVILDGTKITPSYVAQALGIDR